MTPGTKLGPYEILSPLGAGGMGEVYRARDTRLDRTVAIKILPDRFSDRAELRERFEREARTIASLNHPHICTLHDIGHQDGTDYLVMECLEGETLAQKLTKGPLPLEQMLQYAIQIADALDKAHRKGVTHRDLKPGNIMLTKSGAKLLDFGLAKLRQEATPAVGVSQLPTMSQPITAQGVIVGTLQYMAPEQLEGKEADARTDIFAFGAVVYEMATGKKAFEGKSQASVIAKILEIDPPPISSLQPMTPPSLDRLVKTCLAKDPDERWQTASDLCRELKWIAESGSQILSRAAAAGARWRRALPWALFGATVVALIALAYVRFGEKPATSPRPLERFEITPPDPSVGSAGALSPDGTRLALLTEGANGPHLWLRRMDTLEAEPLAGTEHAVGFPFWSPDGRFIAFGTADGKLEKIDTEGGSPLVLCDSGNLVLGGFWTPDGKIIFGDPDLPPGLWEVSAAGGVASPVSGLRPLAALAVALPDGRHFLYFAGVPPQGDVYVGSLDAKESSKEILTGVAPRLAFTPAPDNPDLGYVLFSRGAELGQGGSLLAQPFDLRKLELTGEPVPVADGVSAANFSVSLTGTLVYGSNRGVAALGRLTLFDRQGKTLGTAGEPGLYRDPVFSPDGKRVAAARTDLKSGAENIWIMDLARGIGTRFTFDSGMDVEPIWSPDGRRIVFSSTRSGLPGIYEKLANGGGRADLLFKPPLSAAALNWSGDGRFLLLGAQSVGYATMPVLPLDGNGRVTGKSFLFAQKGVGISGRFSPGPQGRPHWIAYASNESGRYEVYVRPFDPNSPDGTPPGGGKWQVSTNGGMSPRWNANGRELFYMAPDGTVMSVDVNGSGTAFQSGIPKPLFKPKGLATQPNGYFYWDASADGKKFIFAISQGASGSGPRERFTVVLNWTSLLKK